MNFHSAVKSCVCGLDFCPDRTELFFQHRFCFFWFLRVLTIRPGLPHIPESVGQLVENGRRAAVYGGVSGREQVEDDDFVRALSEPRSGEVHRSCRADIPVAAEAVAVDPHQSFAPVAHVEEGVVARSGFELCPVESGSLRLRGRGVADLLRRFFVVEYDRADVPVPQGAGSFGIFEENLPENAFAVGKPGVGVDASHGLDHQRQFRFGVSCRELA